VTPREYLFSLEQFGIKLGLAQIRMLVAALGQPDRAYRSIVVGGTNGKGSVSAMVERALRAAGYRTGRYTSPHLIDIEERVAVDGRPIAREQFDELAAQIQEAAAGLPAPPSFFEASTALALEAFRQAAIDIAVIEVGLGGRLDATNVLSPMGVAITSIDFDHEAHLGSTIDAIAREKAGIIKPDGLCVLGRNGHEARAVIEQACRDAGATLTYAPDNVQASATMRQGRTLLRLQTPSHDYGEVPLGLRGRHQVENAITAVRLVEVLAERGAVTATADDIRAGLTEVEWPARLELRQVDGRDVLVDGAHNPAGARALTAYLQEAYGRRVPIVLGVMRDKQVDRIVEALAPAASAFVCTAPRTPRATPPAELAALVRQIADGVPAFDVDRPADALRKAMTLGTPIVVAGSLYLAGEIRSEWS
jgi:dihydrofolate synthase/folylpolyglutamate synthase